MSTFVVTKRGVYIQDCYGPFEDIANANNAAHNLALAEKDAYHNFDVHELTTEGLGIRFTSRNKRYAEKETT